MIEDDDLQELLTVFKAESEEVFEKLSKGLVILEKSPDQKPLIDEVFRMVHSLKGSARMLGYVHMETLAHAMEDLMGLVRNGTLVLGAKHIDLMYAGIDKLQEYLTAILSTGSDEGIDDGRIAELLRDPERLSREEIRDVVQSLGQGESERQELDDEPEREDEPESEDEPEPTDEPEPDGESVDETESEHMEEQTPSLESSGEETGEIPEDLKELLDVFRVEAEESFEKLSKSLIQLEKNPGQTKLINEIFRLVHSMKGASRMLGFKGMETLAHAMENLLGLVRSGTLSLESHHIDALFKGLDLLQEYMTRILKTGRDDGVEYQAVLEKIEQYSSPEKKGKPVKAAKAEAPLEKKAESSPSSTPPSPPPKSEKPSAPPPPPAGPAVSPPGKSLQKQPARTISDTRQIETVRIPVTKLNKLMSIMEELLVVRIRSEKHLDDIDDTYQQVERWYLDYSDLITRRNEMAFDEFIESIQALASYIESILENVDGLKKNWDEALLRFSFITQRFKEEISSARLLPFSTITSGFPRLIRDISRQQEKEVEFEIEGEDTEIDRSLLERLKDPIMHLLRNAVDHGVEMPEKRREKGKNSKATVRLSALTDTSSINIAVGDDGNGLNYEKIRETAVKKGFLSPEQAKNATEAELKKILFLPGFSTASIITDISGRGVGMDVVQDLIRSIQGKLDVQSEAGVGTTFQLSFPLSLTTRTCILVRAGQITLALPSILVIGITHISIDDISEIRGEPTFIYDKFPLPLIPLEELLKLGKDYFLHRKKVPVVVAASHSGSVGFAVNEILGTQELVIKPVPEFLEQIDILEGCTIFADGTPSFILNLEKLISQAVTKSFMRATGRAKAEQRHRILVVEDSITTQTMEKNLLLSAGFQVETANNGLEAVEKLRMSEFDLVMTDVEMPGMNGFELTKTIRKTDKYKNIPVVLVTSLASEEHKRQGVQVGADAYITKSSFDQSKFLDILERLL